IPSSPGAVAPVDRPGSAVLRIAQALERLARELADVVLAVALQLVQLGDRLVVPASRRRLDDAGQAPGLRPFQGRFGFEVGNRALQEAGAGARREGDPLQGHTPQLLVAAVEYAGQGRTGC